jgi:hypothetical protein
MDGESRAELYDQTKDAAYRLRTQAAEIHELTKRLEELAKDTPAWYAGTRSREWRRGLPWSRLRSLGECWRMWVSGWVNRGPFLYIVSTHCARHSGASKGSAKYPLALFILPSSKSTISQTFMRLPS